MIFTLRKMIHTLSRYIYLSIVLFILLARTACLHATSPSQRFFLKHPLQTVISTTVSQGIEMKELAFFQSVMDQEVEGFIGYHGGCSDYRLFQDLIRFVVQDVLNINVRDDFHFLRIPGTESLCFDSAKAFVRAFGEEIDDTTSYTRQHILSLNIALFQFYDFPLEFTPRYFIQNQPWTSPNYWALLLDFVERIGIDPKDFEKIIALGRSCLPQDRGVLIQFFAEDADPYTFVDTHFYAARAGGKSCGIKPSSLFRLELPDYLSSLVEFPQLRLVINNKHILNPFSSLKMRRYDTCSDHQRQYYEESIRQQIQSLTVKLDKRDAVRQQLLSIWNVNN